MTDPLKLNLTGRVMMSTRRFGIVEPKRIEVFVDAIIAVVHHHYPEGRPSLVNIESLVSEQLVMLESALAVHQAGVSPEPATAFSDLSAPLDEPTFQDPPVDEEPAEAEEVARRPRRKRPPGNGAAGKVISKSMEEKLHDERKPVKKLLSEDCVRDGFLDKKQASRLIKSMAGKQPEDAEQEIVAELRQILQDQVRKTIRHYKGGPWSSPQAQEDMRQDIHLARNVKSILMLNRQIIKEQRVWEKKNGKAGMLGIFASRTRLLR